MTLRFLKLKKNAILPSYAHPGDAGSDLYSVEDKTLKSGERYIFGTGLAVEIPNGYVGLIWERSGLATREGLVALGGVIDSGYRGEIGVALWNLSKKSVTISKGDRIAQLLVQPVLSCKIKEASKLSNTKRGDGGFGSTNAKNT